MGLLDQITGALGQQAGGSGQTNQLMQLALNVINSHPGGLQGLIQQFAQSGLGQQAQSWVSNGQNLPISAEQITQVLGSGKLQEIAKQLGVNHTDAAGGLADLLPQVVNHLNPERCCPGRSRATGAKPAQKQVAGVTVFTGIQARAAER